MLPMQQIQKPEKLTQLVINRLMEFLKSGNAKPGDPIPTERELSATLGVGRSSVREALMVLEYRGLIESRQGKGRFITHELLTNIEVVNWEHIFSPGSNIDLMEARKHIESLAARLAAYRATDEDIAALRSTLDLAVSQLGSTPEFLQTELSLHLKVASACKNPVIYEIVKNLIEKTSDDARRFVSTLPYTLPEITTMFGKLIVAIKRGTPRRAEQLMYDHLDQVEKTLQKMGPE